MVPTIGDDIEFDPPAWVTTSSGPPISADVLLDTTVISELGVRPARSPRGLLHGPRAHRRPYAVVHLSVVTILEIEMGGHTAAAGVDGARPRVVLRPDPDPAGRYRRGASVCAPARVTGDRNVTH
jgi:hypothetical protein